MALVRKDAALSVKDAEAGEKLLPAALDLLGNPEKIAAMEKNILKLALVNAAQIICDEAYKLIK